MQDDKIILESKANELLAEFEICFYDQDQPLALLWAIGICAHAKIPMPDWVASEYQKAFYRYRSATPDDIKKPNICTLGGAFNVGDFRGAKARKQQQRAKWSHWISEEVRKRSAAGESIGPAMYENISNEIFAFSGEVIGPETVERLYSDCEIAGVSIRKQPPTD